MIALALWSGELIQRFGDGWIHGLKIAAAAVVLQAVIQMARTLAVGPIRAGMAIGATLGLIVVAMLQNPTEARDFRTRLRQYVYAALAHLDVDWLGKRIGIIGCGNVGGRLYRRLKAQGVECRVYDPFLSVEQIPELTTLDAVLGCDVVCMHTPLTQSGPHPSCHLIGAHELDGVPATYPFGL